MASSAQKQIACSRRASPELEHDPPLSAVSRLKVLRFILGFRVFRVNFRAARGFEGLGFQVSVV